MAKFMEISCLILKLLNEMNKRIYPLIRGSNAHMHFFIKQGILAATVILLFSVIDCEAWSIVLSTDALLHTQF